MFQGHSKRADSCGIAVTNPWHNNRMDVALHSDRRGATLANTWHSGRGAWHDGRNGCGMTVAGTVA